MDCCRLANPVSECTFRGVHKHVVHLREALPRDRLVALMSQGHLKVSVNGREAARLVPSSPTCSRLFIGDEVIDGALFHTGRSPPRVLDVRGGKAYVWGKKEGDRHAGLHVCSTSGVGCIFLGGEFERVQHTDCGVLVFVKVDSDPADIRRLLCPDTGIELKVHERASVTPLKGGELLIVEPSPNSLCGHSTTDLHRYVVGPRGFRSMFPISLTGRSQFVGLVQWHRNFLLATRGGLHGSRLQSLGPFSPKVGDRIIPVEGALERVWQSPSQKTLVCLSRIHKDSGDVRVLSVDGKPQRTGQFSMGKDDLVWSPDGTVPAARIREGMDGTGVQRLIAPKGDITIPSGSSVSEFLVDDTGRLAARIETDGARDYPYVYGDPQPKGRTLAWNLTWSAGEICYTYASLEIVVSVTDQTHLPH